MVAIENVFYIENGRKDEKGGQQRTKTNILCIKADIIIKKNSNRWTRSHGGIQQGSIDTAKMHDTQFSV